MKRREKKFTDDLKAPKDHEQPKNITSTDKALEEKVGTKFD